MITRHCDSCGNEMTSADHAYLFTRNAIDGPNVTIAVMQRDNSQDVCFKCVVEIVADKANVTKSAASSAQL